MKRRSIFAISLVMFSTACLACTDKDACKSGETACAADAKSVMICESGEWVNKEACVSNACVFTMDGAACLEVGTVDKRVCEPGAVGCTDSGFTKTCSKDGAWRYEVCPAGQTCSEGVCVNGAKPVDPGSNGRACSADGRGIVITTASGSVTKSCEEETGVDSLCVTYNNGLVGCAKPSTCDDVFSVDGTCIGNRLAYCDQTYTDDRPTMVDCAAIGRLCKTIDGKSDCLDTCEAKDEAFACTQVNDIEMVRHCVEASGQRVRKIQNSFCEGDESVFCSGGEIKRTKCATGSKCIASLGVCAETCSESKKDDTKCDLDGQMTMCQQTKEGGWAYVSVGKRECVGDTLNTCISGTDTVNKVDCAHNEYRNSNNELVTTSGRCMKDMQYIPDYDICYPNIPGDACGDVPYDGICSGSVLTYCDIVQDTKSVADCSKNKYGYTSCSVYKGYADCREPCKKVGEAKCEYTEDVDGVGQSVLLLCVPDENDPSNLSYLIAEAGCIGETIYTCDKDKVVKSDCAATGGVCGRRSCEYPLCSIASSETCVDNQKCVIDGNGVVSGMNTCK